VTINKPIIAAQATQSRERVKTVVFKVSGTAPPEIRRYVPEGSSTVQGESQLPEREGQVILYQVNVGGEIIFYVVVNIEGILVWKKAIIGVEFFDYRTGQKWDPLANAYSYLVPYEP